MNKSNNKTQFKAGDADQETIESLLEKVAVKKTKLWLKKKIVKGILTYMKQFLRKYIIFICSFQEKYKSSGE